MVISKKSQKFGASTQNFFRLTRLILGGLPKHLGIRLDIYIKYDDFTGQLGLNRRSGGSVAEGRTTEPRTLAAKDRSCVDFPDKAADESYDPSILLDLDYWVVVPRG